MSYARYTHSHLVLVGLIILVFGEEYVLSIHQFQLIKTVHK
jgi:hypothetical protein